MKLRGRFHDLPRLFEVFMNSKNILFTDMDGTLLLKDSTISNRMRDALREMTKRGHKLVLTSGRPLPSILERI